MSSDKGFGVLEWTGKLVPQGLLVKGKLAPIVDGSVMQFLFICISRIIRTGDHGC